MAILDVLSLDGIGNSVHPKNDPSAFEKKQRYPVPLFAPILSMQSAPRFAGLPDAAANLTSPDR